MFAHLLCASVAETSRPRKTVRLACEQLEDRTVPAVLVYQVNTTDDTPFAQFLNGTRGRGRVHLPADDSRVR